MRCLLLLVSVICSKTQGRLYINPVVNANRPDPGILALQDGSGYAVVSTSDQATWNATPPMPAFPLMFSKNLIDWVQMGHVFEVGHWPDWAETNMWAPEIHYVNGKHHVYFAAKNKHTGIMNIGLAISNDGPFGSYKDFGKPIINQGKDTIDITWLKDPKTSKTYLSWKDDYNNSSIVIQEVLEDGHTLNTSTVPKVIMRAALNDSSCVEGPWFIYREPYYYLLFSAFGFGSPHYHIAVARSKNVDGNYTRWSRNTLEVDWKFDLGLNTTFVGPGHCSSVRTPNGEDWLVYHSWRFGKIFVFPPGRVLMLDKIQWSSEGWPVVGYPSFYPTQVPSIEKSKTDGIEGNCNEIQVKIIT